MIDARKVLDRMQKVAGWFTRIEGDFLMKSCSEALGKTSSGNIVEIGSFKGRSTVVLGSVAKDVEARVWAIDPHEGALTGPKGKHAVPPTFEEFLSNLSAAGLTGTVTPVRKRSSEAGWARQIAFLFIDGLHDYESVSEDFRTFSVWLEPDGLVALHDYSKQFPGVVRLVDEAVASGKFEKTGQRGALVVLKRAPVGKP